MIAHFVRTVKYLRTCYRSFGLIVFGDLNVDFAKESNPSDCKRMMRMVKSCGLEINRDLRSEAFTCLDGDNCSYLDYFLTSGIKVYDVFAQERIGSSDYCWISCRTFGLAPVKRRRQRIFSKVRAAKLMVELLGEDELGGSGADLSLSTLEPIEFFLELSARSKAHSIIYEPKPTNYFKVIQMVVDQHSHPSQLGLDTESCNQL